MTSQKPREISIAFQTDKTPAQYIALAQLVNQYDFDAVTVYCDAPFQPSYGPLLLMAPHITRARLGPAAISPSRIHPLDIAAETALLAQLAQGGVYIGIARGAWLAEHGITELTPPLQAIREAIEVVRYMLSGQSGGYQGQIYQIAEHVTAPYLLPSQKIPLLIGTWGGKMCALAGELADEVKVGGSANPGLVPIMQQYITAGEQKAGRPVGSVGVVMGAVTVADEDREQARYAARRSVALYLPVVAPLDPTVNIEPELIDRLRHHVNRHEYDEAAGLISDDVLDRFAFAGNANDLIRQAEKLFEAGAHRIEFGTPHGLSKPEVGIRILGETVSPALNS
ncbi:MAG: 5,10-methylenetetrahydromethanopterin reductase [Chloroflexota bacterium]|nr:LLM class flavin-dependent oxidoreductase [Chloroflexota bacterium]NOG64923.1 LLM class flavin-dependent oxidoreductase [Chloroflexota bacterium]GIK66401.1 MAG: 5,10-methylenetetrahydromethanopterin reductase [Chloroflexota bacterium]